MAQIIARQRHIPVGLVLDPIEVSQLRVAHDGFARHFEQRPQQKLCADMRRRGHTARARQSRPAQQVHEHRFGLVIELVAERNCIGAQAAVCGVARFTRRGLETLAAAGHADAPDCKPNLPAPAQRAAKAAPCIRVPAQAVMNVNRADAVAEFRRKRAHHVQQHYRVHSTRKPDGNALSTQRVRAKAGAYRAHQPRVSARPLP